MNKGKEVQLNNNFFPAVQKKFLISPSETRMHLTGIKLEENTVKLEC